MSLEAQVTAKVAAFELDLGLTVRGGSTVALLGPNGAGKTTLVRVLAGLVPLRAGRVSVDDRVWDDPARGVFVPPEGRDVGVVFQDYLLFPRMSLRENLAFGLRSRGVRRSVARSRADALLERIGLAGRADDRPGALSGGQAQKVALMRALASEPSILLMDEPLSALDVTTRGTTRSELRADLAAFDGVRIVVTHDPLDAAALADELVIMESGGIVQRGTLAEITAHPRSQYVADLVGLNLLRGVAEPLGFTVDSGTTIATIGQVRGPALAVIHPNAISLSAGRPAGSARNVLPGRIADLELLGDRVRVRVEGAVPLVAEVTTAAVQELGLDTGAAVWMAVKATEISVYADSARD